MTYVLDTYPIVWFLEGSGRLSAQAGTVLRDPSHRFILPTIVLVEIAYLYSKGRIAVDIAKEAHSHGPHDVQNGAPGDQPGRKWS